MPAIPRSHPPAHRSLPSTAGGVWLKGSQRFLGTVLGVALGLAALYFTYLCNGLTYASHPQKVANFVSAGRGRCLKARL